MRIVCELYGVAVDHRRAARFVEALRAVAADVYPDEQIRGLWVHRGIEGRDDARDAIGGRVSVEVVIDVGIDPAEAQILAAIAHRRTLYEACDGPAVAAAIEVRIAELYPDEPEGWIITHGEHTARLFRIEYRDGGRVCASRYVWSVDRIDWTIEYLLDLAPTMMRTEAW